MSATSAFARRTAGVAALLLCGVTPAYAHRLDEYLQATTIAVWTDRVSAQIRLTPGVAVCSAVLAGIDTDGDGALSPAEQRAYAARVLRDLTLAVDGQRLPVRLVAVRFAGVGEMREGRGAIELDVDAVVPNGAGDRRLTFENRHQRRIGAYLVNALVPRDPSVRITAQTRDYAQSVYQLDYVQAGTAAAAWTGVPGWLGTAALLPLGWLALLLQHRAGRPMSSHPASKTDTDSAAGAGAR